VRAKEMHAAARKPYAEYSNRTRGREPGYLKRHLPSLNEVKKKTKEKNFRSTGEGPL